MSNKGVIAIRATETGAAGGGVSMSSEPNLFLPRRVLGSVVIYNGPATGGGVHVEEGLQLWWSTPAASDAATGGDVKTAGSGSVNLLASIVSHSQGGGAACAGTVASAGRNITDTSENRACGLGAAPNNSSLPNTDPRLEPWGELMVSSPAIDAGGLDGYPRIDVHRTDRPQWPGV
jgi:hypothetical protein